MTATDTNHAVAHLRAKLPAHLRPRPRLVYTTGAVHDGVAFCTNHEGHPANTCTRCEVIYVHDSQLAALVVALLRAAGPLAAHLNAIDAWDHRPEQNNPDGPWRCDVCGELGRQPMRCPAWSAADVTRAINQAVAR